MYSRKALGTSEYFRIDLRKVQQKVNALIRRSPKDSDESKL